MVTVVGFQERQTSQGKSFLVLELEGSLQISISQSTGKPYASKSKCTVPCSFDEKTAQELVGTLLPGEIVKAPCEPYDFTNPNTGEVMTLNYRYTYKAPTSHGLPLPNMSTPDVVDVI